MFVRSMLHPTVVQSQLLPICNTYFQPFFLGKSSGGNKRSDWSVQRLPLQIEQTKRGKMHSTAAQCSASGIATCVLSQRQDHLLVEAWAPQLMLLLTSTIILIRHCRSAIAAVNLSSARCPWTAGGLQVLTVTLSFQPKLPTLRASRTCLHQPRPAPPSPIPSSPLPNMVVLLLPIVDAAAAMSAAVPLSAGPPAAPARPLAQSAKPCSWAACVPHPPCIMPPGCEHAASSCCAMACGAMSCDCGFPSAIRLPGIPPLNTP
eukprot:357902-Chlamydomonas_euryale.AAC.14